MCDADVDGRTYARDIDAPYSKCLSLLRRVCVSSPPLYKVTRAKGRVYPNGEGMNDLILDLGRMYQIDKTRGQKAYTPASLKESFIIGWAGAFVERSLKRRGVDFSTYVDNMTLKRRNAHTL